MEPLPETKLKAMLWDLPPDNRSEILRKITSDPSKALDDQRILIRALNTLTWYELTGLVGHEKLFALLSEEVINMLFPQSRRIFYRNAKRLLSKYIISPAG